MCYSDNNDGLPLDAIYKRIWKMSKQTSSYLCFYFS